METVSVSISRVGAAVNAFSDQDGFSTDSNSATATRTCDICSEALASNDLVAVLSCCHSVFHAECLNAWMCRCLYGPTRDSSYSSSPTSSTGTHALHLPTCPRCRAAFEPTAFYTVITQIAAGQLIISSEHGSDLKTIRRVITTVAEEAVDAYGLRFDSRTLRRQGLRSDNMDLGNEEEPEEEQDSTTQPGEEWVEDVHDPEQQGWPEQQNEGHQNDGQNQGNSSGLASWNDSEEPSGISGSSNYARALNLPGRFPPSSPPEGEAIDTVEETEEEDLWDIQEVEQEEHETSLYSWRYGQGQRLGSSPPRSSPMFLADSEGSRSFRNTRTQNISSSESTTIAVGNGAQAAPSAHAVSPSTGSNDAYNSDTSFDAPPSIDRIPMSPTAFAADRTHPRAGPASSTLIPTNLAQVATLPSFPRPGTRSRRLSQATTLVNSSNTTTSSSTPAAAHTSNTSSRAPRPASLVLANPPQRTPSINANPSAYSPHSASRADSMLYDPAIRSSNVHIPAVPRPPTSTTVERAFHRRC